ncbi:seryl-tRNA synthetase [Candidatus Blochmanniella vafra str. BVAF]|uniref:Serine--tRNA ligase n=1 Tax=Blochmanniella vafra (strain BVAF) TaxID=859654 RepID=E8Q686_BLOVB|nr:serine--tRNA ligase [Candidatus Blochmannia vafer]ADV33780.1 seryl-tRNA synthetase [Candidatus Blochmannia vafer str. BVAF]
MLDPKLLYNNTDWVYKRLARKQFLLNTSELRQQNNLRKVLQKKIEKIQSDKKSISKIIGKIKSQQEDIQSLCKQANLLNDQLTSIKFKIKVLQKKIKQYQLSLPNIPDDNIPNGTTEQDNVEIMRWGNLNRYDDFKPIDHVTLGKLIGEIDLSSASKIAGSRFIVLKGKIARLYRALSQFMMDTHIKNHGYQEYYVPYLVNTDSLYGAGQLPKFYKDLFHTQSIVDINCSKIKNKSYTLIPTGEVPLINLMRDIIVNEDELPIKMVAHTPCFRLEAGTYGYRTHGLIRTHQFDKVELVQMVHPNKSTQALEEITNHSEQVLQLLELPYRKTLLCAGNISFSSCKTYDLEVWLPTHNSYCEIASCSNVKDFQARRIKARFRNKIYKKTMLLHTLNASGLAVGRTLVAILENCQLQKDRCIKIPKVLHSYMHGITHIHY